MKEFLRNIFKTGSISFPGNTEEVSSLLEFCSGKGIPVVPSGGRTGLCGGASSTEGSIVLSLKKMNEIRDLNEDIPCITAGAGTITAELQKFAKSSGYYFPLDFAAAGSSTIGGNIATNAGGIHVIRYGDFFCSIFGFFRSFDVLPINKKIKSSDSCL